MICQAAVEPEEDQVVWERLGPIASSRPVLAGDQPRRPRESRLISARRSHDAGHRAAQPYFKCCAKYLFISNIVTLSFPKIGLSLLSARISRRFSGFCRFCFLM